MPTDIIIPILIILFSSFFLFRFILLWYWKINITVSLLQDIREEMKKMNEVLQKAEQNSIK